MLHAFVYLVSWHDYWRLNYGVSLHQNPFMKGCQMFLEVVLPPLLFKYYGWCIQWLPLLLSLQVLCLCWLNHLFSNSADHKGVARIWFFQTYYTLWMFPLLIIDITYHPIFGFVDFERQSIQNALQIVSYVQWFKVPLLLVEILCGCLSCMLGWKIEILCFVVQKNPVPS